MKSDYFVFIDTAGRRWTRVRSALLLAGVLLFLALTIFVHALYVTPFLLPPVNAAVKKETFRSLLRQDEPAAPLPTPPAWLTEKLRSAKRHVRRAPLAPDTNSFVKMGFYVNWDPNSFASLEQNYSRLTHLSPEWFSMDDSSGHLYDESDGRVSDFAAEHGLTLVPLLSNLHDDIWHPEAVENLAHGSQEKRELFFGRVIASLEDVGAGGVLVDWEDVDPWYRDELTALLQQFASALHEKNLELWLSVPVEDDLRVFDLDALAPAVDRFVALLFDETGENDLPGPIASREWFSMWLEALLGYGDARQWIIGLGNFGYDWAEGGPARTISFSDAMSRAETSGAGFIDTGAPYHEPHFYYLARGVSHSVWFLDAISFRNQKQLARRAGAGGIAMHRLGTEDALVWQFFSSHHGIAHSQLKRINTAGPVAQIGSGELITFDNRPLEGRRQISLAENGLWNEKYVSMPRFPVIYHREPASPDMVALTFDDGPSPRYTPRILDILKEKGVKAAFFLMGSNASDNPALVRRIVAEGHILGNHSFSHPDLSAASVNRVTLELNSTQRVIEGLTGLSTVLFRPPYDADMNPNSVEKAMPLLIAQRLGYLTMMAGIDSEDWTRPSAEAILEKVKEHRKEGNVVLLHDAGGDRSQTVEALPAIIDYLRMRGDSIVPLSTLYGMPRDMLMPPLAGEGRSAQSVIARGGLRLIHHAEGFAWAFLIIATAMVLLRAFVILCVALLHKRREAAPLPAQEAHFQPAVSVIIAAFNEGKVIASTLRSVLGSDYGGELELIVIDDGSKDGTAAVVSGLAQQDGRIRLVCQENHGKAQALQRAVGICNHEIIVMLDADTSFEPGTVGALVRPLADTKVGAVSGHARVGNSGRLLTRFQSLEYVCGFNLDRRAYDVLNCITVAPGAVSAFRRCAILGAGGIAADTLAEDTDLTLNIHRAGYRVAYTSRARAWTEAPETVSAFVRQRTRWAFGTIQSLWKNRDMVFDPRYGMLAWFSMPGLWFFHLFLVALVPVADLMLLMSLLGGSAAQIAGYVVAFLAVDLLLAAAACLMEKEPLRLALLMLPMRLVYRPLLSWAVWCSALRVLRGAWVGWDKQERRGTVFVPGTAGVSLGGEVS